MKCAKCGSSLADKNNSSANWSAFLTACPKCSEKVTGAQFAEYVMANAKKSKKKAV